MTKHEKHYKYWIKYGVLYESYTTLRGIRYRSIKEVDMPDCDDCTDEMIEKIEGEA